VKIKGGGSIRPTSPTSVPNVTPGKATQVQAPGGAAPARDTVEINSISAQLAHLEKALSEVGIVDTVRVEAIKAAISEGRLRIDPEMVADKLLATVREYLVNAKP
jgi:negative regulator of flagellin synthesis FlgM